MRPGAEWDLKPTLQRELLLRKDNPSGYITQLEEGGPEYYYDVWGNINFGLVASAANFNEDDLLEGAGLAQIPTTLLRGGLPVREPGVVGWRAWDDPRDQVAVQIGFKLWHQYGLAVNPWDIVQAVEQTPGLEGY